MNFTMNLGVKFIDKFLHMRNTTVKRFSFNFYTTIFVLFLSVFFSCVDRKTKSIDLDPVPLNQILDKYVDEGIWPFLYSKIVHGITGELVYEHLAINKSLLPNQNIDGNTWMRIWSMSKLVTISLAMDLMEEGLLKLDDPVSKYIPEFSNLKVAVDSNLSLIHI